MYKIIYIAATLVMYSGSASQIEETTLKAIYVERFTRFIEWPDYLENEDFFRIQVIGDAATAENFRDIYQRMPIKGKEVLVYASNEYNKNYVPHLIYIVNLKYLDEILIQVKDIPILVVSEGRGGAEAGSMINIYRKNQKLKFEINEKAIHESCLYVSYRLMKSAENIVNPLRSYK